jgi:hypothetical protein
MLGVMSDALTLGQGRPPAARSGLVKRGNIFTPPRPMLLPSSPAYLNVSRIG